MFALGREPEIIKQYVDTGKARFVSRHFAFLGPESFTAAEASECAAEQGRFWEYRELLYKNQGAENSGAFSKDKLKALAPLAGLDAAKFGACLDSGRYADGVRAETAEGRSLGIPGTPTILVDGKIVKGATGLPTAEELKAAIDQALASKGR